MAAQRLDKILVHMGYGSRREITALVRAAKITVNGVICTAPDCKIHPQQDKLMVEGVQVHYQEHWYLMLNKPAGVITATQDAKQQTVLTLLPQQLQRVGMFPVGRLDKDTEGLLLLTTDGAFSHALMSPRKHVAKVYHARITGTLAQDAAQQFAQGIVLADGTVCRQATLTRLQDDWVAVTICEGKYHQVKRMIAAVGGQVTALRRVSIGALSLDDTLPCGAFRALTTQELHALLGEEKTHAQGTESAK